jgi:ABC-type multidrug transport system fused ATPase/permease subunit
VVFVIEAVDCGGEVSINAVAVDINVVVVSVVMMMIMLLLLLMMMMMMAMMAMWLFQVMVVVIFIVMPGFKRQSPSLKQHARKSTTRKERVWVVWLCNVDADRTAISPQLIKLSAHGVDIDGALMPAMQGRWCYSRGG